MGWLRGTGLEPAFCVRIHKNIARELPSPHHREGLSFAQGHPILQSELSEPTVHPEPALLSATTTLAHNTLVPNAYPDSDGGAEVPGSLPHTQTPCCSVRGHRFRRPLPDSHHHPCGKASLDRASGATRIVIQNVLSCATVRQVTLVTLGKWPPGLGFHVCPSTGFWALSTWQLSCYMFQGVMGCSTRAYMGGQQEGG